MLFGKIDELFRYRCFPEILENIAIDYDNEGYIDKLRFLQKEIYALDHCLESSWEIGPEDLSLYWLSIYKSLDNCGISKDRALKWVSQIEKYQLHELQMREGKLPDRFRMNYFYFYKSCDVKLLRRLLYAKFPELKKTFPISQWRNFDYITEVNDDVEDIYEDFSTINGNRFLISIIKNGLDQTADEFLQFVETMRAETFSNKKSYHPLVYDKTIQVANQTKTLIQKRVEEVKSGKAIDSKVLTHLAETAFSES